jgi:Ca-activated chloride channel family protein
VAGLAALYMVAQLPGTADPAVRQHRAARSVAPNRPTRWRHLPAILLIGLVLLTVAMAGPTNDVRSPQPRRGDAGHRRLAVHAGHRRPADRLAAAQEAAKQFASQLTPGINLGLIAYAGTATVLVSPTTNRDATKAAIDKLQLADRTATGEGIFTALQAIATVGAVIGGGDEPPPARIVLMSDGKETVPSNPTTQGRVHRGPHRQGSGRADLHHLFGTPVRLRRDQRPASAGPRRRRDAEEDRRVLRRQRLHRSSLEELKRSSPACSSRSAELVRATPASAGCAWARSSRRWPRWRGC